MEKLIIHQSPAYNKILARVQVSPYYERFVAKPVCGTVVPGQVLCAAAWNGKPDYLPVRWGFHASGQRVHAVTNSPGRLLHCAIPVSGWLRIMGYDEVWLLSAEGQVLTWLLGVYRIEDGLPSAALLSPSPGDFAVAPADAIAAWLHPDAPIPEPSLRIRCAYDL